jgi:hypothetical protein
VVCCVADQRVNIDIDETHPRGRLERDSCLCDGTLYSEADSRLFPIRNLGCDEDQGYEQRGWWRWSR